MYLQMFSPPVDGHLSALQPTTMT